MKALIISADLFEDLELFVPKYRFQEMGWDVTVSSLKQGKINGEHGYEVKIDQPIEQIDPKEFDVLILPGGKAPAKLRRDKKVLSIVKEFFEQKKLVAAICHGPQILVSAGVLKEKKVTCYQEVADEVKQAGAFYEDKEVVVDDFLITSRKPSDLPFFLRELVDRIS